MFVHMNKFAKAGDVVKFTVTYYSIGEYHIRAEHNREGSVAITGMSRDDLEHLAFMINAELQDTDPDFIKCCEDAERANHQA